MAHAASEVQPCTHVAALQHATTPQMNVPPSAAHSASLLHGGMGGQAGPPHSISPGARQVSSGGQSLCVRHCPAASPPPVPPVPVEVAPPAPELVLVLELVAPLELELELVLELVSTTTVLSQAATAPRRVVR